MLIASVSAPTAHRQRVASARLPDLLRHLRHLRRWVAHFGLACFLCSPALAFEMNPGAFANYMAIQPMRERLERSHETIFGTTVEESLSAGLASQRGGAPAAGTLLPAPTTFRRATLGQTTAERMASAYPRESRAQAARTFSELLSGFNRIESQLGLPGNDVANAVAAFLAGNVWALRGAEVPDEHFVTLAAQMRHVLSTNPTFVQTSNRTRQQTYEELAILGMLMATTQMALARQPDPVIATRARAAAADYLQSFLNIPPSRVEITAAGFVVQ